MSLSLQLFNIFLFILEWTYDYTNDKFPYFYHRPECYPNRKQMEDFITVYLNRTQNDDVPTLQDKEQLLNEIALFSLASHLFWAIWGIVNINQDIEFGYWVSMHTYHPDTLSTCFFVGIR